jgi:hypothetical protein
MSRPPQFFQFKAPVEPIGLSESSVVSSTISCKPYQEHIADGTVHCGTNSRVFLDAAE